MVQLNVFFLGLHCDIFITTKDQEQENVTSLDHVSDSPVSNMDRNADSPKNNLDQMADSPMKFEDHNTDSPSSTVDQKADSPRDQRADSPMQISTTHVTQSSCQRLLASDTDKEVLW